MHFGAAREQVNGERQGAEPGGDERRHIGSSHGLRPSVIPYATVCSEGDCEIQYGSVWLHMTKAQLTPLAWIQAAFRALCREGPAGLRAEAIARDLYVSKGSFYWHFNSVPDLKAAMLAHWEEAATADIIAEVDATTDDPTGRLRQLLLIVAQPRDAAYGGAKAEPALRHWAAVDEKAAASVGRVDRARLDYLETLLTQSGRADGRLEAQVIYATLIGLYPLVDAGLAEISETLTRSLEAVLRFDPPSPAP